MRIMLAAAALVYAISVRPAHAQEWLDMQNPQIEVSYVEPKTPAY